MLGRRWEPIAAISTVVVGLVTGLTIPLVSLRLSATGASTALISVAASMPALGILIAALCTGWLAARWPVKTLLLIGVAGSAASIGLLTVTDWMPVWLALRFTVGVASGLLLALGETWISAVSSDATRGRWIALYTAVFTLCQVSGPGLLAALGSAGPQSLLVVVLVHLPGAALLALSRCEVDANPETKSFGLLGFARSAPVIVLAVLMFSFLDAVVLALLPLYGMANGHRETVAVLMVAAVFTGDAVLQIPLGWWADRTDRARLHMACGVLVLVLALAMPSLIGDSTLVWPALVLLGGAAGGVYTLGLVRIGDHFRGADLITANAGATTLWGVGSLVGPPLTGAAIHWLSPDGIMLALAGMAAMFLLSARLPIRPGLGAMQVRPR
ncbi:MFS transporter [Kibdelosporangium philippinense]|uniref:MFS transporter n=1 Tax=Kibdelosporangium philippinense TaxID=211113 RepID=A0ABS8Z919_9PSEU|nr:MFS transporter [Kibdelosporangium philippinense]MCE7003523.1 MFS transporter [Kibdelosporangium philippinense]